MFALGPSSPVVCAHVQAMNRIGGERGARGGPPLFNALPGLSAFWSAKMVRSEVATALHRLANHVECELMTILQMLLVESRPQNARDIVYSGTSFINELREIRDAEEGGDV